MISIHYTMDGLVLLIRLLKNFMKKCFSISSLCTFNNKYTNNFWMKD